MRHILDHKNTISPSLKRAHASMAAGNYQSALRDYEALVEQAGQCPGPEVAFIAFQAGSAQIQIGRPEQALGLFRQGIEILSAHRRYAQMFHSGQRIKTELEKRGMVREARVLIAQIQSCLPASAEMPTQLVRDELPTLPTDCPLCGGTLRTLELHWRTTQQAECSFCSSPIKTK